MDEDRSATIRMLICHDGSPSADVAMACAIELFPAASAVVLHVSKSLVDWGLAPLLRMPDNEQFDRWVRDAAQARLDEALTKLRTLGLDARGELRTTARSVWRTVVEVVNEVKPDVVVVGKHGPGRLGRTRIGSVAQGLATHSPVSLLVVPPEATTAAVDAPVVVAWDGSEGAQHALDAVLAFAPGGQVVIASMWEPMPAWILEPPPSVGPTMGETYEAGARAGAEDAARQGVDQAQAHGRDTEAVVECAEEGVWAAMISVAQSRGARFVSVGSHAGGVLGSLGSVAHGLVAESPVPVLVARTMPASSSGA